MMTDLSRRSAVRIVGLATLGLTSLAGCSGSSGSDGTDDSGGSGGGTSETAAGTPASGSGGSSGGSGGSSGGSDDSSDDSSGGSGGVPSEVADYLSDVDNYSGLSDETGSSSVTVTVGASGNGGNLAFAPAAIRVSTGTEVTWEWNGMGGSHNVVAEDGSFESELVTEEGHTFSHTFEESGVFTYYCQPHKTLGMKGAVVVE